MEGEEWGPVDGIGVSNGGADYLAYAVSILGGDAIYPYPTSYISCIDFFPLDTRLDDKEHWSEATA